jgi:calcineurin-like phosphoesterase family protein
MLLTLHKDENRKVYVTSDTHYSHRNICRGITKWRLADGSIPISQTRDFNTLEEMDDTIVRNINNIVGENDILIHLGDWSFGGFDNIQLFRERINCKEIHLTLGNHDHHIDRNSGNVRTLFTSVSDTLRIEYDKHTIEAFHHPSASWDGLSKGRVHLHGHCHLSNDVKFSCGRRMDVGLDGHPDFSPYLLLDAIEMCMGLPIQSGMFGNLDHHVNDLKNVEG